MTTVCACVVVIDQKRKKRRADQEELSLQFPKKAKM